MPPVVRPSTSQMAVGAAAPAGRAPHDAEHQVVGGRQPAAAVIASRAWSTSRSSRASRVEQTLVEIEAARVAGRHRLRRRCRSARGRSTRSRCRAGTGVALLRVHARALAQPVGDRARVGPRAVGVRVVGLEQDRARGRPRRGTARPCWSSKMQPHTRPRTSRSAPRAEIDAADAVAPHDVHALEQVRHPADLALGVGDLQVGEARRACRENTQSHSEPCGVLRAERHRRGERRVRARWSASTTTSRCASTPWCRSPRTRPTARPTRRV